MSIDKNEPYIRIVRDDKRSPIFWTSCAWSGSGRHRWEDGKSERMLEQIGSPYRFCSLCGVIVPIEEMPRRTVKTRIRTAGQQRGSRRSQVTYCFERDTGGEALCFYCRRDVRNSPVVLDHFIPRSRGGSDGTENRRAACVPCDRKKGARMPWEFMPDRFFRGTVE